MTAKLTASIDDIVSFKSLFSLLCKSSDILRFKVTGNGIESSSLSKDMAAFLEVKIKPEFFEKWDFEGDFMYAYFDVEQFSTMMKNLNSKKVDMVLDENRISFDIAGENKKKHISLVQITGELSDNPGVIGDNCDFSWIMDIDVFKGIICDVMNVGGDEDLSSIYFTWTKDSLKIEARESKTMDFVTDVDMHFVKSGNGHSSFRTKYFSNIIWAGLKKIKFSILSTDGPAVIENCDDEKFSLKFVAAPFVAVDEIPDMEDKRWED